MRKIDRETGRWIEKTEMAMKPSSSKKKRKRGPKPKTYVIMILDKSGSMWSCRDQARSHFNEQVDEIKDSAKDQEVSVSLVMFNGNVYYTYFNENIESLRPLGISEYTTMGSTALNDAIGLTIDKMKQELTDLDKEHVSVLFYIITDGYENSSRFYRSKEELAQRLENLQSSGRWTFTYMGSDHNAIRAASSYSIPVSNSLQFEKKEFAKATERTRTATNDYFKSRHLGRLSSDQFYDKKI